jgi:dolichol-phosphate mannosyltransferase
MIAWLGFRQVGVPYERRPRTAGESKSSRRFLLRFLINAITSFSLGPLRLAGLVSVALCSVTAVWAIVTVVLALSGHGPSTATLLALLIVALAAVNSVLVWALSEYVGRIHVESRRRPVYVIAETVNMVPAAARTSSDQPALGGVEAGR